MNQPQNNMLMDENEIRLALKADRPDRVFLSDGVRARVQTAKRNQLHDSESDGEKTGRWQNEWLRVAASFAPIHLLGRTWETGCAPVSFLALSLGKKLVVTLAFPVLCFLMIGLTVVGMFRIHAIQKGQRQADFDMLKSQHAITMWWKRYGFIAAFIFALTLAAPFLGWTMPLMIALVSSGIAAVSLVRTLAQEGLVDRTMVGGTCVAALGLLGQLSFSLSQGASQLLDPLLVTGVLFGGAFSIAAFLPVHPSTVSAELNPAGSATGRLFRFLKRQFRPIGCLLIAFLAIGICSQSLWRPVTALDVKRHVENFDSRQLGMWRDWADAAKWLNETGIGYDKVIAREHFNEDLVRQPKLGFSMWTAAVRSDLISPLEMRLHPEVQDRRSQLTAAERREQSIPSFDMVHYRVATIAKSPDLSERERQVLVDRLMATWEQLDSGEIRYKVLQRALWLSEIMDILAPDYRRDRRMADVRQWLVEQQVTQASAFRETGGFSVTDRTNSSDRHATLSAICLMDRYGVPAEIDVRQLRSYLRPSCLYDRQAYTYVPKVISRDRLSKLGDVAPLTGMDYLQGELPLWLSISLVLLLGYATLSSPSRTSIGTGRSADLTG